MKKQATTKSAVRKSAPSKRMMRPTKPRQPHASPADARELAAQLEVINSIQHGLASRLDLQAI